MTTISQKVEGSETLPTSGLKVADAVWIATALLHRRHPEQTGFDRARIVEAVQKLLPSGKYRTIWQHVDRHCVANRDPDPNKSRMLFDLGKGYRKLFKDGDSYKLARKGSPTHPEWSVLPAEYKDLQQWYEEEWNTSPKDPLLALVGSGKHLWENESGDEFLARLRSNWGGVE